MIDIQTKKKQYEYIISRLITYEQSLIKLRDNIQTAGIKYLFKMYKSIDYITEESFSFKDDLYNRRWWYIPFQKF